MPRRKYEMTKITSAASGELAFDPIFVCGAPRSGTTLLLSLICTSRSANPFSAECDYLTAFVHPFIVGRNRFDLHTNCYFDSLGDFERYHGDIMRRILADTWTFLGQPRKLVLKDPGMTRYANIILGLLPESRMVLSVRDPKDVVASRVTIEMRRLGVDDPRAIPPDFIEAICREYVAVHEYVVSLGEQALERVHVVRYEQLVGGDGLAGLQRFIGVDDIEPESLWQRSVAMGERKIHSEWVSPLYGRKMTNESVGRYRSVLDAEDAARVDDSCSTTYRKLLEIGGWHE